ncbi:RICIN domain-containing protein [Marinimicrobium sp. C6131]|uniref:RICIN domain-containing protein n=1 Tax=Marinimicrobium sp. C6131 TaxID=3022676 RepID=UPI00223E77C5|nr:RICIN domain-containing protein [Marinimicrobium sp. C6131]UZJ43394.1 RICIN domain-containing protein [Marinimicrobium sp. C6131]
MYLSRLRHSPLVILFCLMILSPSLWADAEVTRTNGNWLARVDGNTVYNGARYFEAINAAINNMGTGTVNIRNSGDSGPDGGNVYAIRPLAGQTLDFHGHTVNANGGDLVVPVYCDRRDNITVRNLHVTGNPRYGVWFRGCSNVTLENITMDLSNNSPVGLGIRVDDSTGPATDLTIAGNININGANGHGVETYGIDGFSIGDVTVTNNGGCGLLLNNSRNGTVGNVTGHYNNQGGGYATFRVANNNGPNVTVQSVYSRNSGRGFFSVSGSNGTTVNYVDIADTTSHGIFLEDASNTHVLSGSVSNGNPNCQLVRTDSSSINVSGCDSVGTAPDDGSGGGSNGTVDGIYRIVPVHSGKTLDVANCGTGNGTNVQQWSWLNNDCQKWDISPVDGDYHRISPLNASSRALDVEGLSTDNGANLMLWEYLGGHNQQFRFQSAGEGRWRIIGRQSEKCLDVEARSQGDGANIVQWTCSADSTNQQFELIRQ